jgi:membrane-associated phospholipid phosphatase
MESDDGARRGLDRVVWALVAATAGAVLLAAGLTDFTLVPESFALPAAVAALAAVGGRFYTVRRPEPRLAAACAGTAQILAFTAVAAPLSYVAASAGLPLQDSVFQAADRAIGLDWVALYRWMDANPSLHPAFAIGYVSLMPQAAALVVVLALAGRLGTLRLFLASFTLAALATIAVSALVPAAGAWPVQGAGAIANPAIEPVTRTLHLAHFEGLRDGSFRLLMAAGSEGIITFPSLHAAAAVLLAAGWWAVPYARFPGLVLNGLMLASTPIDGGHYFIDVAAGVLLAAAALAAAAALSRIPERRVGAAATEAA